MFYFYIFARSRIRSTRKIVTARERIEAATQPVVMRSISMKALTADMPPIKMPTNSNGIGMWTMSYDGQTVLVVHNFGASTANTPVTGYKLTDVIVSNGTCNAGTGTLSIGGYSSAVFLQ